MNRLFKSALAACMLIPGTTFAAGLHSAGFVYIVPGNLMHGSMNVRYNTTIAGSPYIGADGYNGGNINFFGRDSENEYFACYVRPGTSLYQIAVDIRNNLQNGGILYAATADGSQCSNLYLANYSSYQE